MIRAALFAFLLTGCATATPGVIEIPVATPCRVTMPAEPAWATETLTDDSTIWEQAKALLAERLQRIAHITELRAAIDGCNE